MEIGMYEEGRKIGQLTGEMSCTLKIVKKLKEMGFSIKQVLQTIELPESSVLRVFDGKEDIRKIAQDTVNQQIAENGDKIPEERDFIKWVENALEYFMPPQDKEELIPLKEPQRLTCEQWAQYTPYENKLELFDGQALADLRERENMIIALLYNIGLEHFVKILPQESKAILKELINEQ
jgi:DNA-binding transcriptional MerR regulator